MTKHCTKCKLQYDVETGFYYEKRKKRPSSICRFCVMKSVKAWRDRNPGYNKRMK